MTRYMLLNEGDVIRAGDELYSLYSFDWQPAIPTQVVKPGGLPIRRPITPSPDAVETVARALVDWQRDNEFRLGQVQGFQYGTAGDYRLAIRDCWQKDDQVIWQQKVNAADFVADYDVMTHQIDVYLLSLALTAIGYTGRVDAAVGDAQTQEPI